MPKKRLSVTFGRFNLLHNGHLSLFESMRHHSDYVAIGLSTHPKNLPAIQRHNVITKATQHRGITNCTIKMGYQPFDVFEWANKAYPKDFDCCVVLGEDQFSLGNAAAEIYGWEKVIIPRLTSSSVIRTIIAKEQWELLKDHVPMCILNDVVNLYRLELKQQNTTSSQRCHNTSGASFSTPPSTF